MLTIPVWALPLVLTLFLAALGFLYRLTAQTERTTDKLGDIVGRMGALETRLAAVTALETAIALHTQTIEHLRDQHEAHAREITSLRERNHALANELAALRAELARVSSVPTPLPRTRG